MFNDHLYKFSQSLSPKQNYMMQYKR